MKLWKHLCATAILCSVMSIVSPGQSLTTLVNFDGGHGNSPLTALLQGTDGNFYGTTMGGGANVYFGTIFRVTSSGELTTIYSFCSQPGCPDGYWPFAGLV